MADRHRRTGKEEATIVLGAKDGKPVALLRNLVNGALDALGKRVDDTMQEVIDEVGKDGAKKLKLVSSQKFKGKGKYARGWIYDPGKKYRNHKVAMIRNKDQPQLTHLLEFGHPIVKKGAVVGDSPAVEHIEPVNKWCQDELTRRLAEKLKS